MFVSLRRTQTWRLHTKLYKFGWHTSSNDARMKNSRDLILGKVVYISIIYRISDSLLFSLNGYYFYFNHMTCENREYSLSNIDRIFETKRSDHDWEKINIYCSWSNKFNIWCIHVITATFLTRIYIAAFVFEFCNSTLTHWLSCWPWWTLAFHFWRQHFWPKLP